MRKSLRDIVEEDRKKLNDLRIGSERNKLVYKIIDSLGKYIQIDDILPECLDSAIEQLACYKKELCFPIKGFRKKTVSPNIYRYKGEWSTSYRMRCLDYFYNFFSKKIKCDNTPINVIAEYLLSDIKNHFVIDDERRKKKCFLTSNVEINFEYDGEPYTKRYNKIWNVKNNIVSPYMFFDGTGLVVKRANMVAGISIGGEKYLLERVFHDRYVIIFYSNGEPLFYKLDGRMIFPALSRREVKQTKRLEKALKIKEKSERSDLEKYADNALKYLEKEWKRDPDLFKIYGKNIVIDGELERKVCNKRRMVNLRIFKNDNELLDGLYTAAESKGNRIKVDIKGRDILIYDKDRLINAHRFNPFFSVYGIEGCHDIKRMVFLRPKKPSKDLKMQVLYEPYKFSRLTYYPLIKDKDTIKHMAVLADYKKAEKSDFYLLIKRNNGKYEKHPIKPIQ